MLAPLIIMLAGAVLVGAAAFWALRAYRRAGAGRDAARGALALCAATAAVALGVYLVIGRPSLAGAPFEARLEALKNRDPSTITGDEWLAVLNRAARLNPNDATPHLLAGRILLDQGRAREAAREYDAALRREPRSGEALLGLGRATVGVEGRVTPEALAFFHQAAEIDTGDPAPWLYMAMAAMQEDRAADARQAWGEAFRRMAPDDPRREMARRFSTETGR
ncbi:MAG: tetratricopeptide repeat protein [Hyphomonadaceae bacterium]